MAFLPRPCASPDSRLVDLHASWRLASGEGGASPVLGATWAEQPSGSVVLPLESMWKSLNGARWPDGDVYLQSRPW